MKNRIAIHESTIVQNTLQLQTKDSLEGLKPGGQILVDSEGLSFIYLMEDCGDYTYIVIPASFWPSLKTAFDHSFPVWLQSDHEHIELIQFQEELDFVINNVKGNQNYGSEMVETVEGIF